MNYLDYIIIAVYLLGFLGIGYFFKENKNSSDYFLGGRSIGWFPLSLSTMATQLSAISFISAPAFVGLKEGGGLQWLTYELAVPLAMAFLLVMIIPTLYKSGIISVYEFLEKKFKNEEKIDTKMWREMGFKHETKHFKLLKSKFKNNITISKDVDEKERFKRNKYLNVIKNYKRLFSDKCLYGYSDHTKEFINPVATAAIGISVYEKHFTLDNKLPGPDHRMSLEPNELKKTIKLIRETETTLGEFEKTVLKCEIENREKLRKSLVARLDISKGTKVIKEFLTSKRPGTGIPPSEIDKIVGKVALENIIKNTILKKNMFKNNE